MHCGAALCVIKSESIYRQWDMGLSLVDKYTWLHFLAGVASALLNMGVVHVALFAAVFEYVENTPQGIAFIQTYLEPVWAGGKRFADSSINRVGDVAFTVLGWYLARMLLM